MNTICITSDCWNRFWVNIILQLGPPYNDSRVKENLEREYSIVNWRAEPGKSEVVITYTDERFITFFLLRWS